MTRATAKQIAIEQAMKISRITRCEYNGVVFYMVSTPVVARARSLKVQWTAELEQSLHGI